MVSVKEFRTVWLSDIHLGSRGCQAGQLLKFLKSVQCEYLILIGDIIDLWAMKRSFHWPESHNAVVQQVLKMSKNGTKVIFIPGNHDEAMRAHTGTSLGNISIENTYTHALLTGHSMLCVHGDMFDIVTRYRKWVAILGDIAYEFLLWLNIQQNKVRSAVGLGYWSLSKYAKHKVKEAVNFISDYEVSVAEEAKKLSVDAVACGHIHNAELTRMNGIVYANTGDWVESCSGLVERLDGTIELFNWVDGKMVTINTLKI